MQRSSPEGYRRSACSPLKRGEIGPFSNGYMMVYGGRKICSKTTQKPGEREGEEREVSARSSLGKLQEAMGLQIGRTSDDPG